jgi:hypothetical protein
MKRIILIFFSFVVMSNTSFAQKEKYESLFIYNFTKYIKWPDSYNPGKFVIGVLGNSNIFESLESMANSKKKTGSGAEIEVVKYKSMGDIGVCNMLFVSDDVISSLPEIVEMTATNPILLITDTPGMASQGAVINFVEKDGKIKFELNEANATNRNLVVSGSLISLAIII